VGQGAGNGNLGLNGVSELGSEVLFAGFLPVCQMSRVE
jgi:hypothetical protein